MIDLICQASPYLLSDISLPNQDDEGKHASAQSWLPLQQQCLHRHQAIAHVEGLMRPETISCHHRENPLLSSILKAIQPGLDFLISRNHAFTSWIGALVLGRFTQKIQIIQADINPAIPHLREGVAAHPVLT